MSLQRFRATESVLWTIRGPSFGTTAANDLVPALPARSAGNVTLFTGPHGTFATFPMKILVLRDNVLHHLQAGYAGKGYAWIHDVADTVLGQGEACPPAVELWAELSLAFAGIRQVPVMEMAMSHRTRGALVGALNRPSARGTVLLRRAGWATPIPLGGADTLGQLFSDVVRGLERITLCGKASGAIEISSR